MQRNWALHFLSEYAKIDESWRGGSDMNIHLTLRRNADNTISGEAIYENVSGAYDFALDQNFSVRRMTCSFELTHTMPDVYLDRTNTLVYRKANIYRVTGDVPASLKIEYELGENFASDIAYNRISEEMIALDALYINFCPMPIARETTEKIRGYTKFEAGEESVIEFGAFTFSIEGFEPYRVINSDGKYIKQFCQIVPFKLLAVNESKILKREHGKATAYYFNAKESAKAAKSVEIASRMIEWYGENLFPDQEAPERMFFISYDAKKLGGFNRSITIELERFYSPDTLKGRQLLAHEIAHHWCMTGPPATWNEQMLAEGCADWSYLLYCLSRGHLKYRIDYISLANMYLVSAVSFWWYNLFRRTKSFNIHRQGYRLFKGIYKKHGKSVLEDCIRHFNRIEVKTMDAFLRAVEENEPAELYTSIKQLAKKQLS